MSSKPNRDAVQAAFDLLVPALRRVMVPVIKTEHKDNWWGSGIYYQVSPMSQKDLPFKGTDADLDQLDLANWLDVADRNSKAIPNNLGRKVKAAVMPLKYARNEIAHLGTADLPDSETSQYLSNALVLMEIIDKDSAPKIRELIKARRTETAPLVPPKVDPEPVAPTKPVAKPLPGVSSTKSGLLPWRDVIAPHEDVRKGTYQVAEFAADLAQVLAGTSTIEYADADEFFDRTFLTEGMRLLLTNAVRRLSGRAGDPVVQLKTAFGGGKTHSMLSLYHLAKQGPEASDLNGLGQIFLNAGVQGEEFPYCQTAVLVGTNLESAQSWISHGSEKIQVHTLWGEMAAQLAGKQGYDLVRANDQTGVAPGGATLIKLFDLAGPSVILIDELVAYARNLYGKEVSGGNFGAIMSFLQALTEAVKASPQVLLVVSIPESDAEMGGDSGREARNEIELVFGRMESVWKQADAQEGFEIVRRRLFKDVSDPDAMEAVIQAFTRMYADNAGDFPNEAREARYRDRMRASYPIHPEMFAQLYEAWSTLEGFQRTRGVLRLMAHVIHHQYEANDQAPMIMPGALALDQQRLREEFTRYLSGNWDPIIDQDIDGPGSTPIQIEEKNQTLHNIQAARRVARTVFLGSAPGQEREAHRGLTASRIKLGVAIPKDVLGHFDSAISRLAAESRYLYASEDRYWYDTRPNLNRTAADRATQLEDYQVAERITNDLRNLTRARGPFRAIHVTGSGVDVSDEDAVRLVVLPAAAGYKRQQGENAEAVKLAKAILEHRGTAPRVNKNMIVFLAADADLTPNLNQSVRKALAWQSIVSDGESGKLNLDSYGRVTANAQLKESTESLPARIEEAYKWVLIPEQKDGTGPWSIRAESRNGGSGDSLAAKVFRKLESDGTIITGWSPINLNLELEKWFFKDAASVTTARVWEMLSRYGYSARLNDRDVLIRTIADGAKSGDYFAYADGVEDGGRFLGLKFGEAASVVLDGKSVVVRPDAARDQIERDRRVVDPPPDDGTGGTGRVGPGPGPGPIIDPPPPIERIFRTFHGSATVDPNRMIPDFSELVQDVIQHLSIAPGTSVRVRVEIEAENPAGFDERTRRTVSENAVQMKFNHQGFES